MTDTWRTADRGPAARDSSDRLPAAYALGWSALLSQLVYAADAGLRSGGAPEIAGSARPGW